LVTTDVLEECRLNQGQYDPNSDGCGSEASGSLPLAPTLDSTTQAYTAQPTLLTPMTAVVAAASCNDMMANARSAASAHISSLQDMLGAYDSTIHNLCNGLVQSRSDHGLPAHLREINQLKAEVADLRHRNEILNTQVRQQRAAELQQVHARRTVTGQRVRTQRAVRLNVKKTKVYPPDDDAPEVDDCYDFLVGRCYRGDDCIFIHPE
jgi:hypothetical protein